MACSFELIFEQKGLKNLLCIFLCLIDEDLYENVLAIATGESYYIISRASFRCLTWRSCFLAYYYTLLNKLFFCCR